MKQRIWIILSLISLMSISCCADSLGVLNESSTTKDGVTTREFTLMFDAADMNEPVVTEPPIQEEQDYTKELLDTIEEFKSREAIQNISINYSDVDKWNHIHPPISLISENQEPLHPIKAPSITFVLFTIVCLIIIHEIGEYKPEDKQ